MYKASSIGLFLITLFSLGCETKYDLKNTEWLTIRFTIDSVNYVTNADKKVYLGFNPSTKLHMQFLDTLALAFVENRAIDTSVYKVIKDTLFYIQGSRHDTSIILKLTCDSLIEHRLAGVVTHSARFNTH